MSTPISIAYPLPDRTTLGAHEVAALRRHLRRCLETRGPWFSMACFGEAVHAFFAPRFVTTLVLAAMMLGAAALVAG